MMFSLNLLFNDDFSSRLYGLNYHIIRIDLQLTETQFMKLTEKRTEALKANRLLDLSMVNQNFPAQKLGESLPIDNRSSFQYLIEL